MNLLIKDVNIIDAKDSYYGSVLVKEGKIEKIYREISEINTDNETKVIEGKGHYLMPSFIDVHTHLRDPGYTYKEDIQSGIKAALKGGFTTICAMANTNPVCDNEETIKYIIDKSKKSLDCDLIQISALTKNLDGKEMVSLQEMRNYTSLFSDDGVTVLDEDIMKEGLLKSRELDFKILTHCQPEVEIVKRDLKLLDILGGNLHICHISREETLEEIIKYKNKGIKFTCEVTPHHIFHHSLDYHVNPSFRNREDMDSLIKGIKDGYIDMIATDHAPHSIEDKENGSPGISSIEVAFSMVYKVFIENNISLNTLSKLMSYNPAKFLNLNSGLIKEGYEGNLVLIDGNEKYRIDTNEFLSKGKNNPFHDKEVMGKVKMTINRGKIVYIGGTVNDN